MPKSDPQFKETVKRYRCERCMGEIREKVIRRTTNLHWHPRCACGRPMTQIDRLNRFVRPKAPRASKPKPEMEGQMSFDGSIVGAQDDTIRATTGAA